MRSLKKRTGSGRFPPVLLAAPLLDVRSMAVEPLSSAHRSWLEKPAVAVQTNAQQIHPDVANSDHHKANHSNKSRASALPTATEAGVQISGVHHPAN